MNELAMQYSPEYTEYRKEIDSLETKCENLERHIEDQSVRLLTANRTIETLTQDVVNARFEKREYMDVHQRRIMHMSQEQGDLLVDLDKLTAEKAKLQDGNLNMLHQLDQAIQREAELKSQINTLEEEHLDKLESMEDRQNLFNAIRAHIVTELIEEVNGYTLPEVAGCDPTEVYIDLSGIGVGTNMFVTMDELAAQYLEYYAQCEVGEVIHALFNDSDKPKTKAKPKPKPRAKPQTAAKGKPRPASIRK